MVGQSPAAHRATPPLRAVRARSVPLIRLFSRWVIVIRTVGRERRRGSGRAVTPGQPLGFPRGSRRVVVPRTPCPSPPYAAAGRWA